MADHSELPVVKKASQKRRLVIPAILATIAWTATAFDFYDRHWLLDSELVEMPLSEENARLDAKVVQPVFTEQKAFYMNIYLANNGHNIATQLMHIGFSAPSPIQIDSDFIDAIFIALKTKFRKLPSATGNEITPGQTDQWFTVPDGPGLQLGQDAFTAAKNGTVFIYTFNMMRYTDKTVPPGKYIYSEKCVYTIGSVLHNCEMGHNRTFIAD